MTLNRRHTTAALLLGATPLIARAQGGPVAGRHYDELPKPLPTLAPGKVEVIEFFWYGCPHCLAFEPHVEAWAKALPPDVVFRKSHVAFRGNIKMHQRMFFALEALGVEARVRPAVFAALQRDGLPLDSAGSQAKFLAGQGVDAAKYEAAWNSMGVISKCVQAEKLSEAYDIDGVPAMGIGGRFLTSPSRVAAGQRLSEDELARRALAATDFLINRIRNKS